MYVLYTTANACPFKSAKHEYQQGQHYAEAENAGNSGKSQTLSRQHGPKQIKYPLEPWSEFLRRFLGLCFTAKLGSKFLELSRNVNQNEGQSTMTLKRRNSISFRKILKQAKGKTN